MSLFSQSKCQDGKKIRQKRKRHYMYLVHYRETLRPSLTYKIKIIIGTLLLLKKLGLENSGLLIQKKNLFEACILYKIQKCIFMRDFSFNYLLLPKYVFGHVK